MMKERLREVLGLAERLLAAYSPRIVEQEAEESRLLDGGVQGFLRLRIETLNPRATIVLREYWRRGSLEAYGYYVGVEGYREWWDNRPHHPEVETHPHHRHVGGEILPLHDPCIEAFLRRVQELLERHRRHG